MCLRKVLYIDLRFVDPLLKQQLVDRSYSTNTTYFDNQFTRQQIVSFLYSLFPRLFLPLMKCNHLKVIEYYNQNVLYVFSQMPEKISISVCKCALNHIQFKTLLVHRLQQTRFNHFNPFICVKVIFFSPSLGRRQC